MREEEEEEKEEGGGKGGGVHRVLDHTYPELSVARATLVSERRVNVAEIINMAG